MKSIAHAQPSLPLRSAGPHIDVTATLMRRVLPLGLALGAWALLIEGCYLAISALL
jgi:hypothetical protein